MTGQEYRTELIHALSSLDLHQVECFGNMILETQGRIFIAGNGGSAATASHMACDFTKSSKGKIKAFCLTDSSSLITALANDISYEDIISWQVRSLMESGDLLILISGSGNSDNILSAAEIADLDNIQTFALLGMGGGILDTIVDSSIIVDSYNYGVIEDVHLTIEHMVTEYIKTIYQR
jgi:D-sedoheptulose 7-phosphate isomerase